MDPDGVEIVRCIEMALEKAGRAPEEIGYISYHGTSTQLNDAIESRCVRRVFGSHADRVPGSSIKSMIGHPQGASGAAGVASTVLAMRHGVLPPTINLDDPDPACDMDFIPKQGRAALHRCGAVQLPRVRFQELGADPRPCRLMSSSSGAGPAGSIAALTLARAGVTVRLLDRARFPRDKLCGDTVNPGSLALLDGLGLGARVRSVAVPVRGMTVTGPGDARVVAEYPDGIAGAALTRRQLDQMFVEAAVGAGVVFDEGVSVAGTRVSDQGRVERVTARWAGAERDIQARLVIAADGRASRIGSSMGLSSFASRPRRWAFGAYYDGVDGLTDRGEMHVRQDGYIGVAPLPGGIANVCVVRELDESCALAGRTRSGHRRRDRSRHAASRSLRARDAHLGRDRARAAGRRRARLGLSGTAAGGGCGGIRRSHDR